MARVMDVDSPPGESSGIVAELPRRHRLRWVLSVAGVIVLLVVAAGIWFVFGGERAHEVSEADARRRLEGAAGIATSGPAPGLYRYEGTGSEHTSFPPLTEYQGKRMPATVTAGENGCWDLRVDFNTHHYQQWTYCIEGGRLTERGGATFSRRVFGTLHIDNVTTITCDPPAVVLDFAAKLGAARHRSCTGSGTAVKGDMTTAGVTTIVGEETVQVGRRRVRAVHVRYDGKLSGAQTGTERTDDWFATSNGMLVKNTHRIEVVTESPVGRITYTENARFSLKTFQPVK